MQYKAYTVLFHQVLLVSSIKKTTFYNTCEEHKFSTKDSNLLLSHKGSRILLLYDQSYIITLSHDYGLA